MKTSYTNYWYPVILITAFIFISNSSGATDLSPLSEREQERIKRGGVIVREIEAGHQNGLVVEAVGIMEATPDVILAVLTDYLKYPEFMPNVSRVEIVEQQNRESILNYTLSLPLGKRKRYRLKINRPEHAGHLSILEWQLVPWPGLKPSETIKDTKGYWHVKEYTKTSSLVRYHVYTDPGPIPFGMGWIVDTLSKKSVPDLGRWAKNSQK